MHGIVKRFFVSFVIVNLFLLVLFAICRHTGFINTFLYLHEDISAKFILAVFGINAVAIGFMMYGRLDTCFVKTPVSKIRLAFLLLPLFLVIGSFRFREMYGLVSVEQLFFHYIMPETGANLETVYKILWHTAVDTIVAFTLLVLLLSVKVTFKRWGKTLYINSGKKCRRIVLSLFAVFGTVFFVVNMGFPAFIFSLTRKPSRFYETNYIDPNNVDITFPEQKRNLIVIFVESLDTSFLKQENGGAFSQALLPNIENLMQNNINFSSSYGLGGAHALYGTGWTAAGIVAQYSGVPLTISLLKQSKQNNYKTLGNHFMPFASGVGDILHDAGYSNYFILGSRAEFGGRDKYFSDHKDTVVYDYDYFVNNMADSPVMPAGYDVWWGIEDRKLYGLAKEKITEIAKGEPFFVTMITTDTHPPGGYLDSQAQRPFDSRLKNVFLDNDKQLADFLEWLSRQDFYENTTVAVLGDHLYQDSSAFPRDFRTHSLPSRYGASYYEGKASGGYGRFVINIFINSLLSPDYSKNRVFSHFDIFPTLIDSVGGKYDAPGLALGRSINKGEKTLPETMGLDEVDSALQQSSEYYTRLWWK